MNSVSVWEEKVIIPTYEIGEAEKNPIFLEKRVYQGSCGKVYPYPTIEKISTEKTDKEYTALYLENEYLKIMILPELGGRIQRATDKTNNYDFVYYNQVIKPALVGLTGPWISGGIEFNWPQHHRPTTFLPTDYVLEEHEDGSKSVLIHDVDQMYGTKGIAKFTLYPGKSYLEVEGQLYNRTSLPQTFLWWANPAVSVNDYTQSIFPPDVHAVMDHGKRDVSSFPIATGTYYKQDYSAGVDISRYKNIPVPTSYMAETSKYDFVGGYDYSKEAGILHVADHHISPGKKQWTWGCGDFGKAWDRNLTDEDGPYIELMTGMFTDNQPDFTWLKPMEEKTFQQYFMPYKKVGQVKNATKEAVLHFSFENNTVSIIAYATEKRTQAEVLLTYRGARLLSEKTSLSPNDIYNRTITQEELAALLPDADITELREDEFCISVWDKEHCLVSYQPEPPCTPELPEPAKPAKEPEDIPTNEELYFTGLHIEQYRHATYLPDPYYLEGLKRDPLDVRLNNAYGSLLLRRGLFAEAEDYFRTALKRLTERNPNPYNSESYYLLGLSLFYQEKQEEAYDMFYKATWSNEQQEMAFYYLAALACRQGNFILAYSHIERALVKNAHNIKARGLKVWLLRKLNRVEAAKQFVLENLALDPFDFVSGWEELSLSDNDTDLTTEFFRKTRHFAENHLLAARDYAEFGAYEEAICILEACKVKTPLLYYYLAYYAKKLSDAGVNSSSSAKKPESTDVTALLRLAEACPADYCFPNKPEDIAVLTFAGEFPATPKAKYYLGCLFYDKLQWKKSVTLWETSRVEDNTFPTVHRNLALAYYNKEHAPEKAKHALETAFSLDTTDARVFLELDQLYKKLGISFAERLARYEAHPELICTRDDMYVEYITLVHLCGNPEKALSCMKHHSFHPWEGGEGKITTQYVLCLLALAKKALAAQDFVTAEQLLRSALTYPENLGEGKLEGTKDNHIYYHLGLALDAQGKSEEALSCYRLATIGTDEPAGAMYYNDQPADMIYYQGLALLKLGNTAAARERFERLECYGQKHLHDTVKLDYFAVSLPDFLIFDDDYTLQNKVHCHYLMGLAALGFSMLENNNQRLKQQAGAQFAKALELNPAHMMAHLYYKELNETQL